jgi:hypothetical protein
MVMVFDLIDQAQEGILFLLFEPGTPSVAASSDRELGFKLRNYAYKGRR